MKKQEKKCELIIPVIKENYYKVYNEKFTKTKNKYMANNFEDNSYKLLNERNKKFKAFGIREEGMIPYLKEHTKC